MRIVRASLALKIFDSQQKVIFLKRIKKCRQSILLARRSMLAYIGPMELWQYNRNSVSIGV